jgi:hypothetical protein
MRSILCANGRVSRQSLACSTVAFWVTRSMDARAKVSLPGPIEQRLSSELVSLRWDDVDFTTGRLHVRRAKGGETAVHPLRHAASLPSLMRIGPSAMAEFRTIRQRLIKIGARVIEHIARIRIHLPTSCPERALFRAVALRLMPSGP